MAKNGKGKMNRRTFIKNVGIGLGAAGMSVSLPKVVKQAYAQNRDHILIGRPIPKTGPISAFAEPTPWLDDRALGEINKDGGIFIKEYGKKVPVKVKFVDTNSNPSNAADAGAKLILKDKIDMMYVSSTPATVSPVAAACDRYEVPSISTMMPVEMFLHGGPFKWAYCASSSVKDMMAAYLESWKQIETNKVVGLMAANDADGASWANGAAHVLEPAGYKVVDLGRFPSGTKDFSAFVNGWKKENVEIIFANIVPPDFVTAWRQCYQQGFTPKICAIGRAVLFPSVVEAVGGEIGNGVSTEVLWHPDYPFKSSLAGYGGRVLTDAYEKDNNKPWTQPMGGFYLGYEIIADVLRRAQSVDKETIRKALADTNLETIGGPVKFNDQNIAVTPVGLIQWVKGTKFPFKAQLVSGGNYPEIKPQGKMKTIAELQNKG